MSLYNKQHGHTQKHKHLRHNTALASDMQVGKHELARKALEDAEEKRKENGRARREEVRKMLDSMRAREDEDSRLGEPEDPPPKR